MLVLAGDIGGTNARLALVDRANGRARITERHTYPSAAYDDVLPIVDRFRERIGAEPDAACLAIACPILDGRCSPANLPWTVELEGFAERVGIPGARIINDFDAVGHAVPRLGPDQLHTLRAGTPRPAEPYAVLGAGTGLGVGLVLNDGAEPRVVSSEGGHADFAPNSELEAEFWRFLRNRHDRESDGHVSSERALSGSGLVAIYEFLQGSGKAEADPLTRAAMKAEDAAAVISRRGLSGEDPAASAALDLLVRMMGSVAGNFALAFQAFGGVYLSGGVVQHNLDAFERGGFLDAFDAKGRVRHLVQGIPIHVVTEPDVGLLGAAWAARTGEPAS